MRFTQDVSSSVNVVRSYGQGELRINGETFHSTLIVAATAIRAEPALGAVTDLADELEAVLAAGADELPAIVAALNERGGHWTESTLRQRLAELGA